MKVAIVGHGPSIEYVDGKQIDSFDKVVRLKGSHTVIGRLGVKIDALCASTEIMGTFFKMEAPEYWAYPKNGQFDGETAIKAISILGQPVMIPLEFSNFWNQKFRMLGAKHNCVSTGMAAIIFSIYRWAPEEITLFGFDTMLDPKTEFSRFNEIPRSGAGRFPNHDWEKENELLGILTETYNVRINDPLQTTVSDATAHSTDTERKQAHIDI